MKPRRPFTYLVAWMISLGWAHEGRAAPKVFFVTPRDNSEVPQEFVARFGVKDLTVAPAGERKPGEGHHHVIVDGGPVPRGEFVPFDDRHLHFGKGQTETTLKLSPGRHRLTLQFADGTHASYGPKLSHTIEVRVTEQARPTP